MKHKVYAINVCELVYYIMCVCVFNYAVLNIKMLSASVKLKYPKIVATCTFNKWFDGKTWCMLEVSLTQGSFKRSATSEKKGSAERSVMVELQLDSEIFDVHPGTVYYYRVSLVDTEYNVTGNITVTGMFELILLSILSSQFKHTHEMHLKC